MPVSMGRMRKSTRERNRNLIRISVGNKNLTSKELARELKDISNVELPTTTVRRRLLEGGFRECKVVKKNSCRQKNKTVNWSEHGLTLNSRLRSEGRFCSVMSQLLL